MTARAYAETGGSDDARRLLEEIAGGGFARLPIDVIWLWSATDYAAVCAALGDAAVARVLYDLLAPYAAQLPVFCFSTAGGVVAHHLRLLARTMGDFDRADTDFASAAAAHTRIGAPTWLARTRLEWAQALLRRGSPGDGEQARILAGQAGDTARELGLGGLEGRASAPLGRPDLPSQ